MKTLKKLLAGFLLMLPLLSMAETMVVGKGDYQYSDKIFSSTPDENERVYALNKAKSNAILAYADTLSEATRKLFEEKRAQFLSNPDRYIIRYNVAKDKMDKESRMYSVIIEAVVDDAKIKNDIGDSYGSKNAALAKNNIAVFFIAREVAASTSFDAKVTKVAQAQSEKTGSASASSSDGTTSAAESASQTSVATTGGSTVQKSDVQEYRVDEISRGEFGGFLTDVFSSKGMENILDGGFFEAITLMQNDYGKGTTIKPMTWRKIMRELRDPENDIKYIVVGTVDLSAKETHRATGKPIVSATVSAKIYNIQGKLPKIVTALRPITIKGMGNDQSLAKKNALNNCAKDAADEIIDKLRGKGLL